MPIHFEDRDVLAEIRGLRSALIVPCKMCPAVTVAVRENKPFMNVFRSVLKSAPFEQYLRELKSRLKDNGVQATVFKSTPWHQWFMCMWSSRKRKKLEARAEGFDAVIVLGCESATETVRHALGSAECKVIEGMTVTGITNAELRIKWPGTVSFGNCRTVPLSGDRG